MFARHNGRQYCNCTTIQFIDESASSVESALKKIRRDPHQFVKKGSEAGASVKEWEADDLASIFDDKRRLYRFKKRAERQNQWPHQMQPSPMAAANLQFRQTNINKFGLCFKISIRDYACVLVFKLKSEMFSLNNVTFLTLLDSY